MLSIYRGFTEDSTKFVRASAIEVIGYFLNVLPSDIPSNSIRFILEFYKKTLDIIQNSKDVASSADNETLYLCAYNFPAVLLIFKKEAWKELKPYYTKMASDKFYKVRKSLACSINEVASILGKEDTETSLIPIFDRFYKEEGEI